MDIHHSDDEQLQYSTFLYIWNQETSKGFFRDMKNVSEVLDLQNKENLDQQHEVQNAEQLLQLLQAGQEDAIKEHFSARMSMLFRFAPEAIE